MKQEFALWGGGGVHLLGQGAERHPARFEVIHRREQMRQRPTQAVQLPDNKAVTRLKERERFAEAGAVAPVTAGVVIEEVTGIDPRCRPSLKIFM